MATPNSSSGGKDPSFTIGAPICYANAEALIENIMVFAIALFVCLLLQWRGRGRSERKTRHGVNSSKYPRWQIINLDELIVSSISGLHFLGISPKLCSAIQTNIRAKPE
eukprot:scaffold33510_cov140-Skeletonema_dohrnii-CCMP3373.AAC.9